MTCLLVSFDTKWKKAIKFMLQTTEYYYLFIICCQNNFGLFKFAARIRRPWLVAIGFIILILSVMWVTNNVTIYGQIFQPSQSQTPSTASQSSSLNTTTTSFVAHGVRITSPVKGQQVPVGILTVTGTSKDNATTDCQVFVIVNGIKPYQ